MVKNSRIHREWTGCFENNQSTLIYSHWITRQVGRLSPIVCGQVATVATNLDRFHSMKPIHHRLIETGQLVKFTSYPHLMGNRITVEFTQLSINSPSVKTLGG
jgi:hypothetical protein